MLRQARRGRLGRPNFYKNKWLFDCREGESRRAGGGIAYCRDNQKTVMYVFNINSEGRQDYFGDSGKIGSKTTTQGASPASIALKDGYDCF